MDRKRQFEKIPGETRKIIAEQLGTTPAQIGRYDSIAKHLIAAFKTWLEEGKINISVAYELSTMTEREQLKALDWARSMKRGPSIDEVKRLREQMRTPEETPKVEREPVEAPDAAVEREEQEDGTPPVHWERVPEQERTETETVGEDGKVVHFPAPPSPSPVPEPKKEPMHRRMAANILEDLQLYCEEMIAVEAGLADTWAERAEALTVAIDTLRK